MQTNYKQMEIAKVNDYISWKHSDGIIYSSPVSFVDEIEKVYCVYVPYAGGQDKIPFDAIINKIEQKSYKPIYELLNDPVTARKLLLLYHPSLDSIDNERLMKLVSRGNYHWVQIYGRVKGYGDIGICIDDCYLQGFWGKQPKEAFIKRHKDLRFHVWRTVFDHTHHECEVSNTALCQQANKILIEANYRVKTVDEWFTQYYND